LFDLVDELTKELEIENKLCRLRPVAPSQLPPPMPVRQPTPSSVPASPASVAPAAVLSAATNTAGSPSPGPPLPATITLPTSPVPPRLASPPAVAIVAGAAAQPVVILPPPPSVSSASSESDLPPPSVVNVSPNVIVARAPAADDGQLTALTARGGRGSFESAPVTLQPLLPTSLGTHFNLVQTEGEEATPMDILSDIDEVIRDDTSVNTVVSNDSGTGGSGSSNGNSSSNVTGVITLSICGICQRYFTDVDAFREHEASGCIDFEVS
jgi:hypothetical protein